MEYVRLLRRRRWIRRVVIALGCGRRPSPCPCLRLSPGVNSLRTERRGGVWLRLCLCLRLRLVDAMILKGTGGGRDGAWEREWECGKGGLKNGGHIDRQGPCSALRERDCDRDLLR
jgi:hypothetical protein